MFGFWFILICLILFAIALVFVPVKKILATHANNNDGQIHKIKISVIFIVLFCTGLIFIIYENIGARSELALKYQLNQLQDGHKIILTLEDYNKEHPENASVLLTLIDIYTRLKDYPKAITVYEQFFAVSEPTAELLAGYAKAKFMLSDKQINIETLSVLEQLIKLEPDNFTALELLGIYAFQQEDFNMAISYWQRALDQQPDESIAKSLQSGIDVAKKKLDSTK